jgi:hypothetical protein
MFRNWSELPLVLLQEHVCAIFDFHPRTLRRWLTQEEMLDPLKPRAKQKRWQRDEMRAWIDAGCPPMSEWRKRRREKGDDQRGSKAG